MLNAASAGLDSLVTELRRFRDEGGTALDAQRVLEEIRPMATDQIEDVILEGLDFVVGFCSPEKKIWSG
ncbi:MAG: hypothetical protein IT383_06820 [Deltaproteobacteria bacterium]|nr:hypothetical protein [Deltaproteobacteria bacterium]